MGVDTRWISFTLAPLLREARINADQYVTPRLCSLVVNRRELIGNLNTHSRSSWHDALPPKQRAHRDARYSDGRSLNTDISVAFGVVGGTCNSTVEDSLGRAEGDGCVVCGLRVILGTMVYTSTVRLE